MQRIRSTLLSILYLLFKVVVKAALRWFHGRITVVRPEDGGRPARPPCIVVTNHPGTLLDPLNTAVRLDFPVHFLANASIFRNRFTNWFFNTFYCIPIERYQDTGGRPLDNAASFRRAVDHLSAGGSLYIAPEGTSYIDRHLRKIKTGTARIALEAEQSASFELGLTILPIGLNYRDPTVIRSELLVKFGDPIQVSEYGELQEADPVAAVQALTERIRQSLAMLMIDTQDATEEAHLKTLEALWRASSGKDAYGMWKAGRQCLALLREQNGHLRKMVIDFRAELSESGLLMEEIVRKAGKTQFLRLGWLTAFSLPGYLLHGPPVWAAYRLDRQLNDDIHWRPTYLFLGGLITYPVWFTFLGALLYPIGGMVSVLATIVWSYPLGLVAEAHYKLWKKRRAIRRAAEHERRHPEDHARLLAKKEAILRFLEAAGLT